MLIATEALAVHEDMYTLTAYMNYSTVYEYIILVSTTEEWNARSTQHHMQRIL